MSSSSNTASLDRLHDEVRTCRACELWEGATQAVVGEGARDADVMFVGEQPGDREDIEGHPFVGPAGRVLDTGLDQAGIPRDDVYITNVVKHFRYKLRGKRRIHQKPDRSQITACVPGWRRSCGLLLRSARLPRGDRCAGAARKPHPHRPRSRPPLDSELAEFVTITAHPSSILRARDDAEREQAMDAFVSDLKGVAAWLRAR